MRKSFTKIAIAALAMMISSVGYAQNEEGTRVDYLNADGEIVQSSYVSVNTEPFFVHNAGNGLCVSGSMSTDYVRSMKFTPWGEVSYPIEVEVAAGENKDVKVTYEVIDDSGSSVRKAPGQDGDVKCGSLIRFHIDVPENRYPAIRVNFKMTGYNPSNDEYYDYVLSSDGFRRLEDMELWSDAIMSIHPALRKEIKTGLESTGIFVRDSQNPNHWTLDAYMQNEPMRFEIFTQKRDFEKLRNITTSALRNLYRPYMDMMFGPMCSGETWFMGAGGDYMGQDLISGLCASRGEYMPYIVGMGFLPLANYVGAYYVYGLSMAYITHANIVLSILDDFEEVTEAEREWARGQMLALRSHGYWRLLQNFGMRWQDSDNGSAYCAPLETTFSAENQPLATMKEIRDHCYADLDLAISKLSGTSVQRREALEIDATTAKGIKMRIALLCEDWKEVDKLAVEIMQSAKFTSNDALTAGFFNSEDSWIWSASNMGYLGDSKQNWLYYWSFQSHEACNGMYPSYWEYGPNAIDYELYELMSKTDIRRSLYAMPDQLVAAPYNNLSSWINSEYVNQITLVAERNGSWMEASREISDNNYRARIPAGVALPAFTSYEYYVPVQFGAQVKFYSPDPSTLGETSVVFMRTEEIALSRAEAACHLGNYDTAVNILKQINGLRDSSYSFSGTGQSVMDEIIRTRRLELWGEGHSWYDRKRWKLPIDRKFAFSGDKMGNWPFYNQSVYESIRYIDTDFANGWRYVLPNAAVECNPAIDVTLMKYTEDPGRTTPESMSVGTPVVSFKNKMELQECQGLSKEKQDAPMFKLTL